MKTHYLKTIQPYFDEVWYRQKTFELRKVDRDFQISDTLILQEYEPTSDLYSGFQIEAKISHILRDFEGISNGFCILSLCEIKHHHV